MFELIQPVAPSTLVATDEDVDRIEQAYACQLPSDYRAFLKTFGPGTLDDGTFTTEIFSPGEVIARTEELRDLLREPGEEPPWHLLFFDLQEDAATYFTPADSDRFIAIAGDDSGSTSIIVPGDLPHYYELPHDAPIGDAGTTIDSFLAYLDPRVRYEPHARRIVEKGVVHETDGQPDGTPCILRFIPQGYEPSETHPLVEQEVMWGHGDDGLVAWSKSRIDIEQRPTDFPFHMAHYP
nr:SMI1/KNR4 family protein [Chloroflexota bacterium]